jgi:hypothetical protein
MADFESQSRYVEFVDGSYGGADLTIAQSRNIDPLECGSHAAAPAQAWLAHSKAGGSTVLLAAIGLT